MNKINMLLMITITVTCLYLGCTGQNVSLVRDRQRIYTNCELAIIKLLNEGKRVSLCVNVPHVNNSCRLSPTELQRWKKAVKNRIGDFFQNVVFSFFDKYPGFSLIDRQQLSNVLREYELTQIGLVSDETRIEVGNLIGMNYMANITRSRYCGRQTILDVTMLYLVHIQTGEIVALDTIQSERRFNKRKRRLNVVRSELNGQEVIIGKDQRTIYLK